MGWYAQYVDSFEFVENIKAKSKSNGQLLSFMPLSSPIRFDKLLEGMQHYSELNKYILK